MIKRMKWDSDFFNLEVGELDIKKGNYLEGYTDYDLLYAISPEEFDLKLDGFENSFSEQKVKFYKELQETKNLSENVFSYTQTAYDIHEVYDLAYESGKHSRFLLDENFEPEKFKELYKLWIDNSITKNFADDILLFKSEGKTIGLLSYKIIHNDASVGLIAVSLQHQGMGIGAIMLRHLETTLYDKGILSLTIPTQQENQQACYFYTKQGYSISENTFIKHYWKINDTI